MSQKDEPFTATSFWITLVAIAGIAYFVGHSNGSDSEIASEAKYGPKTDVGRYVFSNQSNVFFINDTVTGTVKIIILNNGAKSVRTIRFSDTDTP